MSLAVLTFIGAGCASKNTEKVAVSTKTTTEEYGNADLSTLKDVKADTGLVKKMDTAKPAAPSAADQATPPVPKVFPGILSAAEIHGKVARLKTDKGEIVFELLDKEAPKTVSNFVALANSRYFDALTFHRVVPGFVIQGGDPLGNGTGGPGYKFEDEPVRLDYNAGIVAMANSGPDTNGSQFFIVLEDQPTLPKAYTIFGRVTKGMDVVHAIRMGDHMQTVRIEKK